MRFYEFEAKQLLAKAGIATRPHPEPSRYGCDLCCSPLSLGEGEGPGVRE